MTTAEDRQKIANQIQDAMEAQHKTKFHPDLGLSINDAGFLRAYLKSGRKAADICVDMVRIGFSGARVIPPDSSNPYCNGYFEVTAKVSA